jgi:galactose oxidase-like protein/Kelch motif protein
MKLRQISWIALQLVMAAGPVANVSLARASVQPLPIRPQLTADVRRRLAEAARSGAIAPWQREVMLEVARGRPGDVAPSSPLLADVTSRKTGALADDGAWIGVPPPFERYQHTAVYDPVRDRMVVFGGDGDGGTFNDVWALSLAGSPAWSMLDPVGSPPAARNRHTAIYDPVRDRMVVFGGYNRSGDTYHNDVWALSLAGTPVWSELTPAGNSPAARLGHSAIYDPVRDRMVVFGGFDSVATRNDVWALSLAGTTAWSELTPAGILPAPLWHHTAIYDPVRDRMIVLGGTSNDVWALSLAGTAAWSAIAGSPPVGGGYAAIYDPASDRMVVFAGDTELDLNYVCALSLAGTPAWSELVPAGSPPPARYGHTVIYDPVRGRMVVFGGFEGIAYNYGNPILYGNDAWALSLEGSPTWSALSTAAPSERVDHTAIYEPLRHSMVAFGGYDGTFFNDVWSLPLAGSQGDWSATSVSGSPPAARAGHTAIYDPVRDRMIVFGGETNVSTFNDVWALWLAGSPVWIALDPMGSPPVARSYHTAIYDPLRDRMIVFGGAGGGSLLNDVWALSLAGTPKPNELDDADVWSELAPAGSPPTARAEHTAIYDPVRDRMVVFGGEDSSNFPFCNDAWALSLAGTPTWSALAPAGIQPLGCAGHAAIYDAARNRMVVFGGLNGLYSNYVYALEWKTPLVSVPGDADGHRRRYEIAPPRPNPSRGATTVAFELGEPGRVVLDVLDINGRRVRRLADDWFPAGGHVSTWRGDDDRGRALGSGVYFIRIQGTGFQATRRIVRIR